MLPFIFNWIPIIIITHTLFGEFYFSRTLPDRIKILHILFIILSAAKATTDCPHTSVYKECLICNTQILFLALRIPQHRFKFNHQSIKNHAYCHYLCNIYHGNNQSHLSSISNILISLKILLEASVINPFTYFIYDRRYWYVCHHTLLLKCSAFK